MTDNPESSYDDYQQSVIEQVDELLADALDHANTYVSHDEVRPSAVMGFDKVEKARLELNKIDERNFTEEDVPNSYITKGDE